MSLHAAVLHDVLWVTTISKTSSKLCIHWTDSPIEYSVQTPPSNRWKLLFYFDKTRTGAWKNPVGKLIIRKAVFWYHFFNSITNGLSTIYSICLASYVVENVGIVLIINKRKKIEFAREILVLYCLWSILGIVSIWKNFLYGAFRRRGLVHSIQPLWVSVEGRAKRSWGSRETWHSGWKYMG